MASGLFRAGNEVLDAIWPRVCLLCGAAAEHGACAVHALPEPVDGPRCGRCAARLPEVLPDGERCPACRRRAPGFRRLVAPFDWRTQPAIRDWVLALKYGGRGDLAGLLGGRVAESWRRVFPNGVEEVGPLVPVPLHPRRRAERGYDQALLLAHGIGDALGVPVRPVLRRTRPTAVQGGPGAVSRAANVRGVFRPRVGWGWRWRGGATPEELRGRTVWLVDDVVTSGSTVRECARVLRRLGAREVGVLAVARAASSAGPGRGADGPGGIDYPLVR